jgi:hypothetical protein
MNGELKMEMLIVGVFFAPFILAISYIVCSVMLKTLAVVYADAFSLMGWDTPRKKLDAIL